LSIWFFHFDPDKKCKFMTRNELFMIYNSTATMPAIFKVSEWIVIGFGLDLDWIDNTKK